MSGLDGNVRSPRAAREKRNPSIFLFYQSFMNKSGLCAVSCYLPHQIYHFVFYVISSPSLSVLIFLFHFNCFSNALHKNKEMQRCDLHPPLYL